MPTLPQYTKWWKSQPLWWRVVQNLCWRLSHLKAAIFGGPSAAELLLIDAWPTDETLRPLKYIEIDPQRRSGEPVILGTRFPLSILLADIFDDIDVRNVVREIAEEYGQEPEVFLSAFKEIIIRAPEILKARFPAGEES